MKTEDRVREAFAPYRSSLTMDEIKTRRSPADREVEPPSRPRRRRWTVGVGLAAALAVLGLLLHVIVPLGGPGAPDPAVATILHRFARVARDAPAESPPAAGQFLYSESLVTASYVFVSGDGAHRFVYEEPMTERRWLGTDASGRVVSDVGQITFATPQDRAEYESWIAGGGPQTDGFSFVPERYVDVYAAGELSYLDTSDLPTDVDSLQALIESREILGGPEGDWETFVLAADLLRSSWARPELRAALYEVMARLPGIEIVGRVSDAAGREGIALASTHNGQRNEIVFSPKTAEILEARTVVVTRLRTPREP